MTELHNINFPDFTRNVEESRFDDARRPGHCRSARWMAESDGRVVGFAQYDQNPGTFDPRKFELEFTVDPAFYGRGIGRRLYALLIDALAPFDPVSVDTWSREDMPCLLGFLERRGFVEDMRLWASVLDMATFDPSHWAHRVPPVEAQGIQVRTLAELGPHDPAVQRKLYDLWSELRADIPIPPEEVRVDVSFERFWEVHNRPSLLSAGFFLALDGDRYIGTSYLWLAPEPDVLRTGVTGVLRDYRRRGIAFALKILALKFAKEHGYQRVQTENESNNRGMLGINEQLGFVRKPAWIHFRKAFAR